MADISFNAKKRVLSGMRPTGKLHLGNYMGALHNWVKLQNEVDENGEPKYECYFFIADWHALTTDYAHPGNIKQNTLDVALDFLAAGLDPEKSTIFVQSHVPQHAELHLLLSMITPLSWLERVPSYKDQQEQLREKDLATYGFLGYPLLQSADILMYQPQFVPVGADQVAHIEITREIARRFNSLYWNREGRSTTQHNGFSYLTSNDRSPLAQPEPLLTDSPKLPGTDGRKMSKSYDNTILLSDPLPVVFDKLKTMSNGGQRLHVTDPGNPDICPVADLHRVFSTSQVDAEIRLKCRNAEFSCQECKEILARSLSFTLSSIHLTRSRFEGDPEHTWNILGRGSAKAASRASETMEQVRRALGLSQDASGLHRSSIVTETWKQQNEVRYVFREKAATLELLEPARNVNVTKKWLSNSLPNAILLSNLEGTAYLASRNRRVLILSSVASPADTWLFRIKRKSYEVLVLLCVDQYIAEVEQDTFGLSDFVIPQKVYRASWSEIEKAVKEMNIEIRRVQNEYFLHIALADPINITEYLGNYEALR